MTADQIARMELAADSRARIGLLTEKERQYIELRSKGLRVKDIALVLGVKANTLKQRSAVAMGKLGAATMDEAVARVIQYKLDAARVALRGALRMASDGMTMRAVVELLNHGIADSE